METEFNVDQVFQIARRIQQNGAEFYEEMAKRFRESGLRGLCSELAKCRAERAKALAEGRKEFFGGSGLPETSGRDDYIMSHPSEMADLAVFSHDQYHSKPLTGQESREEILKDAIGRCEEVIVFFQGLKGFVQDAFSKKTLNRIIEEEQNYIYQLRARAKMYDPFWDKYK
jgi:rubrerythrin